MEKELKKNLKDIVLSVLFVAGEGIEKSLTSRKKNLTRCWTNLKPNFVTKRAFI